jgi:hypothetical protein
MSLFKLDNNNEFSAKCRTCFPNLRYRITLSIGQWGMLYGSKTDYFTVDGKKIGFKIVRHYDRKGLPIYNDKQRIYIYTGE